MYNHIDIGGKKVGDEHPCYIVGEIGINHNGDIDLARKLIAAANNAGVDAVKFQKRTVDLVYTPEELAKERETPFGTTNGDYKRGIEFGVEEYEKINGTCAVLGMNWFASCWDINAVEFISKFDPPCYKIASACLTDDELLWYTAGKGKPIIMSTAMSTMGQIKHAITIIRESCKEHGESTDNVVLLQCTGTYPITDPKHINLRAMHTLRKSFGTLVGYSGHETGLSATTAAVAMGACVVERHITLNRAMWGSDQGASVEISGLTRLVRDIRYIEAAMGDGAKRVLDEELPIMKKLRRVTTESQETVYTPYYDDDHEWLERKRSFKSDVWE